MKILALEFSSDHRSVAVLDTAATSGAVGSALEVEVGGRSTHICAMVNAALRQAGLGKEAIEILAIGLGPGSYTGIRAAIAFADGWGLARAVRLVGVSSVQCVAARFHAEGRTGPVLVAADAQRGEFYLAGYELGPAAWHEVEPLRLVSGGELAERLRQGATVAGIDLPARFTGSHRVYPDAAQVACLAARRPALGPNESLEPISLRPASFVKASAPRVIV